MASAIMPFACWNRLNTRRVAGPNMRSSLPVSWPSLGVSAEIGQISDAQTGIPRESLSFSLENKENRLSIPPILSTVARNLSGNAFVDHYAAIREWEERQFRRHIEDRELAR
jgi:hypothetical protein